MYDHFPAITASWYTQWREVVKRRRHEEREWKRNTDNRKPEVRYRSDTSVGERKVAVLILQWVRKLEWVVGTGWSWLRVGTGGGHLWVR